MSKSKKSKSRKYSIEPSLDLSPPAIHLDEIKGEKRLIARVRFSSIDGVCHRDYALWEINVDGKKYYAMTTSVSVPGFETPAQVWGLGHTPEEALRMAYLIMVGFIEDNVMSWEVTQAFESFYEQLKGE